MRTFSILRQKVAGLRSRPTSIQHFVFTLIVNICEIQSNESNLIQLNYSFFSSHFIGSYTVLLKHVLHQKFILETFLNKEFLNVENVPSK